MSTAARVAAFVALLAATFAAATVAGRAVDPEDGRNDAHSAASAHGTHGDGDASQLGGGTPDGLSLADTEYRLQTSTTRLPAGRRARLRFRIVDGRGATVRDFDVEQARRLHLIIVRRDLDGYQHLHPAQAADGGWSVALTLPSAGAYRAFADFRIDGRQHVLGVDQLAPGRFAPRELPPPATVARVAGYDIAWRAHGDGQLSFDVRRDGVPVTDLDPYLGARGHLVALRQGDLAYRHAHPARSGSAGAQISFERIVLQAGVYRLFLQFRHGGRVHTATFTHQVRR